MKKTFLFIIIILFTFNLFAQNKLNFSDSNISKIDLSKNFKNYKILKLDNLARKISSGTAIKIDYIKEFNFVLKENKILSNDYLINIKNEKGLEQKSIFDIGFDGKYFINEDFTKDNQFVFSTFENSFTVYVKNSTSEFYMEPLLKFDKNATSNDYVYYETKDIISEDLNCGNTNKQEEKQINPKITNKNNLINGCKTIELAMSMDYNFYNTYGSVNAAIDKTLQVLNLTQANYTIANGLSNNVQFLVTEHYIVTCPALCNYWTPTLDIFANYDNFGLYSSKMFVNPYDIKVHWQNEGGTATAIGLGSYIMCGTSGIAVVKNYANDLNFTRCILSHELGHNLGCIHDTEIMAATLSLSNNWSLGSITTINNSLNTLSCLSNCNNSVCDNKKATNVSVTVDNPNNKINATWLAEDGIDFKVRLYNSSTNTWSNYTTFLYPINSTSYNFSPTYCLDNYRVEITPFCGTIKGTSEQIVVQTSKNVGTPTINFVGNPSAPACGASAAYFEVTAIDQGTSPIYQWKVNNVNVGTNASNYSSNSLITNDVLSCTITSNATCVLSPTATVTATVNITTPTVLSNSISVTQSTICPGTSVTFTATGTNVTGANPYYGWFLNGQPYSSGPTGGQNGVPTLTVIPANNGDIFTCKLYDSSGCHIDFVGISNAITITIQNPCNLSTDEFDLDSFNYFPNPIENELNISLKEEITEVNLYNILGQKIFLKIINSNKATIDTSYLPVGTYYLKIKSGNKFKSVKILKV